MYRQRNSENPWASLDGPNLAYVLEQYDRFINDPNSVHESLREKFEVFGAPQELVLTEATQTNQPFQPEKLVQAIRLAENIRTYGHLAADIYPVGDYPKDGHYIDYKSYGLTESDLKSIPARLIWENAPGSVSSAWDAVHTLKDFYTKTVAYEFSHVHESEERQWLFEMAEQNKRAKQLSDEERKQLLYRLTEVEGFERFLHKTFVGQKRFSIEGVDMLVPILDAAILQGAHDGTKDVMIGMAHRGRLSVLAHVLRKPLKLIFSEFHHSPNKDLIPSEGSRGINFGWTGDVKYHLGANRTVEEKLKVTLAHNPSHLEYVNPVVEGYTRAAQDTRTEKGYPVQDVNKAFSILIHGDAAFPGEGVVAETLNLSGLNGYQTGGTIHIIANNLLGFTTDSKDSRSTRYASDLAKGYEIPVIHVNADDPEACIHAMHFAYEYRKKFNKDVLIDLIGFRKYGHNETDDPAATQPQLYGLISKKESVREKYANHLIQEKVIEADVPASYEAEVLKKNQDAYDFVVTNHKESFKMEDTELPEPLSKGIPLLDTAVPADVLTDINNKMLDWPEDFSVYPKVKRILERRKTVLENNDPIEWGMAEALAYATIVADGTPIRLTGQDSERGTFAQRHLVLHDSETGKGYSPLHGLPDANASFALFNSPLTEAAVVGFEYGYNVFAPETLVLWEAQYGDFSNCAQVLFDQFITAGRAKWGQKSGMVMLLPHGYEGQGPEHSSARLERFLQLCAENNWIVANVTSAAQYFHLLRRQALLLSHDEVRPLVLMTPKSLLRHPKVSSPIDHLAEGQFQTFIPQQGLGNDPIKVEKVVLCTGKITVDLMVAAEKENNDFSYLSIVSIEQLYPFSQDAVGEYLRQFPNLKEICWVQEEPQNMGAWTFMEPKLWDIAPENTTISYIGRPERSSPAGGEPEVYKQEQERIIQLALEQVSE